ncbi:hypothetical protein BDN71DRAFT_1451143 [Pleurotus eryngii]|uniref:Uncharacterized protein n=1 Tax=Pleurotus eryngii TaxID=5323 RepID=A0A9P5ZVS3_PLEER|nr:hypothetical protein BDN71DRAFT_1451143 [Pleurotus eryngii]
MGRWTQYDEDAYRLPAGIERTAYDADTGVYTYRDGNGQIYEGSPHQRYGTLRPVSQPPASTRPMFDKDKAPLSVVTKSPGSAPKSFADILSPDQVTSASPIHDGRSPTKSTSPKSRFIDAVRRAAAPKMLDVVHHATMSKRTNFALDSEKQRLLPEDVPQMSEKGRNSLTSSATSAGHHSSAPSARSATTASTLARAATSASHRSSPPVSGLARSSTTASSLVRSATNASSRSGASLVRSATNASTYSTASTTSLSHLVNAKPLRVDSMRELPSVPTRRPHHSSSSSASKRSSSQSRRPVEAL